MLQKKILIKIENMQEKQTFLGHLRLLRLDNYPLKNHSVEHGTISFFKNVNEEFFRM